MFQQFLYSLRHRRLAQGLAVLVLLWCALSLVLALNPPLAERWSREANTLHPWLRGISHLFRYRQPAPVSNHADLALDLLGLSAWLLTDDGILRSHDSGQSWKWLYRTGGSDPKLHALFLTGGSSGVLDSRFIWAAGERGTLVASRDFGKSWQSQPTCTVNTLRSIYFVDANNGWAVGDSGSICATVKGSDWAAQSLVGNPEKKGKLAAVTLRSIFFLDATNGWIVGDQGVVLHTADGGRTWVEQDSTVSTDLKSVRFLTPELGWAVGEEGTILRTDNGGKDWRNDPHPDFGNLIALRVMADADGGYRLQAGAADGALLEKDNADAPWRKQGSAPGWVTAWQFSSGETAWAVESHFGRIHITRNGGMDWDSPRRLSFRLFPIGYWYFTAIVAGSVLLGIFRIRSDPKVEAASEMPSSDRPQQGGDLDSLGSKPLAWAVSRFLRHRRTEPPLTIAINAPWGGGKSSLMNWLREDLERFGYRPVWFNAWHYERQEQMFPALMENIRNHAIPPWLTRDGFKFRGKLLWLRARENKLLGLLLLAILAFAVGYSQHNLQRLSALAAHQLGCGWEKVFPVQGVIDRKNWLRDNLCEEEDEVETPRPLQEAATGPVETPLEDEAGAQVSPAKAKAQSGGKLDSAGSPKTAAAAVKDSTSSGAAGGTSTKPGNPPPAKSNETGKAPEAKISPPKVKNTERSKDYTEWLLTWFPWLAPLLGFLRGIQAFQTPDEFFRKFLSSSEESKSRREIAVKERFARDFEVVTAALPKPLVIFVDDLDRCQPRSVCEVLETVNFLSLAGRCYVLFGIWREGVERAVGLGFAETAMEFHSIHALSSRHGATSIIHTAAAGGHEAVPEAGAEVDKTEIRRRYGQLYLEKLINIWVTVPAMGTAEAETLLTPEIPEEAPVGRERGEPGAWRRMLERARNGAESVRRCLVTRSWWVTRFDRGSMVFIQAWDRFARGWQRKRNNVRRLKAVLRNRETWRAVAVGQAALRFLPRTVTTIVWLSFVAVILLGLHDLLKSHWNSSAGTYSGGRVEWHEYHFLKIAVALFGLVYALLPGRYCYLIFGKRSPEERLVPDFVLSDLRSITWKPVARFGYRALIRYIRVLILLLATVLLVSPASKSYSRAVAAVYSGGFFALLCLVYLALPSWLSSLFSWLIPPPPRELRNLVRLRFGTGNGDLDGTPGSAIAHAADPSRSGLKEWLARWLVVDVQGIAEYAKWLGFRFLWVAVFWVLAGVAATRQFGWVRWLAVPLLIYCVLPSRIVARVFQSVLPESPFALKKLLYAGVLGGGIYGLYGLHGDGLKWPPAKLPLLDEWRTSYQAAEAFGGEPLLDGSRAEREGAAWASKGEQSSQSPTDRAGSGDGGGSPAPAVARTTPIPAQASQPEISRGAIGWSPDDFLVQESLVMLLALLFFLRHLTYSVETPEDSEALTQALEFWSSVLSARFSTPRRIKRFFNHLRFNAMRIHARSLTAADPTVWERLWEKYVLLKPDRVSAEVSGSRESMLLFLSVVEACCGANQRLKSKLVNRSGEKAPFAAGWQDELAIDAQLVAENGAAWADQLQRTLVERLKMFERNRMAQPSIQFLETFERLMPARITPGSVRPSGGSEGALKWEAHMPDRRDPHNQGPRRTRVFPNFSQDRRTGIERRRHPVPPAGALGKG